MNSGYRQSQAFFESRYQAASDPWEFASSVYELGRYQATLASLSRNRYKRAYEPGCSVGVLTSALAQRCDLVIACDISPKAVREARVRCAPFSNVTLNVANVSLAMPEGPFDLIVFSEIGYYLSPDDLKAVTCKLLTLLGPGGEFIAVHWLGDSADHLLHGDRVHEVLAETLQLEPVVRSRHEGFRIDSWRQPG